MSIRRFSKLVFFLPLLLCSAAACSKEAGPKDAPASGAQSVAVAPGHAPAGVKPGSHEDWCGEHGVPESQCSRCNPELIPAFKATGDWCAEHGLPESQCLKCNPNLTITRPPKGS
ncbi:hypothetical protein [Chondromyces crocatus]|uniref:RND transporter n=1 Tax=Chondromyces crocatus TaxID=52 RepID=A0A0K1EP21_CHOCO|nr:hypothetical protein [Chondromyces crocatus]AKT42373.1 uncharacterized protein CMC5_065990 [Chondromyces crocatus]